MKKVLCIVFALLLAVTGFMTGCAEQKPVTTDTTAAETDTGVDTVTTEPEETKAPDGLPDMDFGGRTFRIITTEVSEKDVFTEDHLTADPLHDAVYTRNLNVEERFKIKLDITGPKPARILLERCQYR